jgi:hypothetical protein
MLQAMEYKLHAMITQIIVKIEIMEAFANEKRHLVTNGRMAGFRGPEPFQQLRPGINQLPNRWRIREW